jgi:hypothetical protein
MEGRNPAMSLPDAERAYVPNIKLTGYLLSPDFLITQGEKGRLATWGRMDSQRIVCMM